VVGLSWSGLAQAQHPFRDDVLHHFDVPPPIDWAGAPVTSAAHPSSQDVVPDAAVTTGAATVVAAATACPQLRASLASDGCGAPVEAPAR
jgi:hypothetical protein